MRGKLSFPGCPDASFLMRGILILPLPGIPETQWEVQIRDYDTVKVYGVVKILPGKLTVEPR